MEHTSTAYRGDKRRLMIAAACTLYAQRDMKDGAMRRDEMCVKLDMSLKLFAVIAEDLRASLLQLGNKCNSVIRACLERNFTTHDLLDRMLNIMFQSVESLSKGSSAEKMDADKALLRKAILRIEGKIDESKMPTASGNEMPIKLHAIFIYAAGLFDFKVELKDVARVGCLVVSRLEDCLFLLKTLMKEENKISKARKASNADTVPTSRDASKDSIKPTSRDASKENRKNDAVIASNKRARITADVK